jgi:hypothetical protein
MEQTFLIAVLLITFRSFGQKEDLVFPVKDGHIIFEEVIGIDSLKKDDLYNRAKLWIINTFKSPKQVLTTDDKELGIIKGNGIFIILKGHLQEETVRFTFEIDLKDYKYKYSFSDFNFLDNYGNSTNITIDYYYNYYNSGKNLGRGMVIRLLQASKEKIETIVSALKSSITKPSTDW